MQNSLVLADRTKGADVSLVLGLELPFWGRPSGEQE